MSVRVSGGSRVIGGLVGTAMDEHIDLKRREPGALHSMAAEVGTEVERTRCLLQFLQGHARTDGGAEKHVSAESGEAVEVGNAHGKSRRAKAQDLTI